MRRDIKKRLEKALVTLQEPGGSTIRSIIKIINKDSPVLSLRKVLEALQEGINEGFLCMYNGRFKLKQQMLSSYPSDSFKDDDAFGFEEGSDEERDGDEIPKTFESDEESDFESEDGNYQGCDLKNALVLKKNVGKRWGEVRAERKSNARSSKNAISPKKKRTRCFSKCRNNRNKCGGKNRAGKSKKFSKEPFESGCDSLLEITPGFSKRETACKPITEKPDVKKQRGPRCTSMKKDIRMPSKVHIPFAPPTVPQRSNFNDLLRRSPEPVNGPLFDCHKDLSLMPENLGFFGTYCS